MKRFILLLFFSIIASTSIFANRPENKTRDSIISVCDKLKTNREKIIFLIVSFEEYVDEDWSIVLPKMILDYAIKEKDIDKQFSAYYNIVKYYQYRSNLDKIEQYFKTIRQLSYKHKKYDLYFNTWNSIVELYLVMGETERSYIEINKMAREARVLKSDRGVVVTYVSLAYYYSIIDNPQKSLYYYSKALEQKCVNINTRISIHERRADVYYQIKKYPEAINEIKQEQSSILSIIKDSIEYRSTYNSMLFGSELFLCDLYEEKKDYNEFVKHLHNAEKLYKANSFTPYEVNYHEIRAKYYKKKRDWNKALSEYDYAISLLTSDDEQDKNIILHNKADLLFESGRYKDAYNVYKYVEHKTDSVTHDILAKNEREHIENEKVNNIILKEKNLENKVAVFFIVIALISIVFITFIVYRLYWIRKRLKKSKAEIQNQCKRVEEENKSKEKFLKNIDFDIRTPLNAVVGFSNVLCEEKDISQEERENYSKVIKQSTDFLMKLIFNILDYSRHEAGMMKYTIQEYDAVRICIDSKMMNEIRNNKSGMISFSTEVESAMIDTDCSHFMKMMTSLFEPLEGYKFDKEIDCHVSVDKENVIIKIKRSPLLLACKVEQQHRLQNNINKLFTQTFKGSYIVDDDDMEPSVTIKYPLNKRLKK